jgi:RNA polymerase sigma-70 factor, ECF subfamily
LSSLVTARILPSGRTNERENSTSAAILTNSKDVSDELLFSRLVDGDSDALACLFRRYAGLVLGIGRRILRHPAEAEDLVQDLFLFIHRKCVIFDGSKSSVRSWIVQMTYHRAIERRRYLTTRQFYGRGALPDVAERVVGVTTTESDYSLEEVFGRNGLEKVVESLSEDQRETLRLYFFEGYTLAEISEKLGQPRGNIRNHYYRGLARLRQQMSESSVPIAGRHDE